MAEKILNTRIQLKRDTLTNWNESSLVLKPGELAVAYVDVATTDAKGNIVHVPTAILKAGENKEGSTKTFKELPFVSAIAADVYAWAKKEGIEVIDEGEGEVISDVAWDASKNALVLTRIDVVTPAEQAETLKSYYTKSEIDTKIQEINGTNSGLANRVKSLEDYKDTHGDIVTHNVSEFATAAQGTTADNTAVTIATYGDIVTHDADEFAPANIDTGVHAVSLTGGTNNGTVKLTVDGTATDNIAVTGLGDAAYTTVSALNATAKGYADAVEEQLADYTKTADLPTDLGDFANEAGYAKTAEVTETLKGYYTKDDIDGKVGTINGAIDLKADKSVVEAMYTNDEIDALVGAKDANIIEVIKVNGTALEVTDKTVDITVPTDAQIRAAAADEINTLIGAADDEGGETIQKIADLVDYVEKNGAQIAQLVTDVNTANTNANAAVETANNANTTAGTANTTAGEAKALAEEAKEAATNATTGATASAEAAAASALAAKGSEDAAKGYAEAAAADADDAEAARAAAVVAQGAAEAAKGAAEQAKADAESAKNAAAQSATNAAGAEQNAAGYAQNASESAGAASASASAANSAKDGAVAAQGAAEAAQGKAEAAQSAAETARDDAVAAKEAAEASNTSATAIANQAKETANGAKTAADAATEAVAGLHAIAKSGNVNDLVQTSGDVLILDCGTASTVI